MATSAIKWQPNDGNQNTFQNSFLWEIIADTGEQIISYPAATDIGIRILTPDNQIIDISDSFEVIKTEENQYEIKLKSGKSLREVLDDAGVLGFGLDDLKIEVYSNNLEVGWSEQPITVSDSATVANFFRPDLGDFQLFPSNKDPSIEFQGYYDSDTGEITDTDLSNYNIEIDNEYNGDKLRFILSDFDTSDSISRFDLVVGSKQYTFTDFSIKNGNILELNVEDIVDQLQRIDSGEHLNRFFSLFVEFEDASGDKNLVVEGPYRFVDEVIDRSNIEIIRNVERNGVDEDDLEAGTQIFELKNVTEDQIPEIDYIKIGDIEFGPASISLDENGNVTIEDTDLKDAINRLSRDENGQLETGKLIIAFKSIGEFNIKVNAVDDLVEGSIENTEYVGSEFFNETIEITLSGGDNPDTQSINSLKFADNELEEGNHYSLVNGSLILNNAAIGETYPDLKSEIEALAQGASKDINIEIEVQDGANDTDTITKEITIEGDFVENVVEIVSAEFVDSNGNLIDDLLSDGEVTLQNLENNITSDFKITFKSEETIGLVSYSIKDVNGSLIAGGSEPAVKSSGSDNEYEIIIDTSIRALILEEKFKFEFTIDEQTIESQVVSIVDDPQPIASYFLGYSDGQGGIVRVDEDDTLSYEQLISEEFNYKLYVEVKNIPADAYFIEVKASGFKSTDTRLVGDQIIFEEDVPKSKILSINADFIAEKITEDDLTNDNFDFDLTVGIYSENASVIFENQKSFKVVSDLDITPPKIENLGDEGNSGEITIDFEEDLNNQIDSDVIISDDNSETSLKEMKENVEFSVSNQAEILESLRALDPDIKWENALEKSLITFANNDDTENAPLTLTAVGKVFVNNIRNSIKDSEPFEIGFNVRISDAAGNITDKNFTLKINGEVVEDTTPPEIENLGDEGNSGVIELSSEGLTEEIDDDLVISDNFTSKDYLADNAEIKLNNLQEISQQLAEKFPNNANDWEAMLENIEANLSIEVDSENTPLILGGVGRFLVSVISDLLDEGDDINLNFSLAVRDEEGNISEENFAIKINGTNELDPVIKQKSDNTDEQSLEDGVQLFEFENISNSSEIPPREYVQFGVDEDGYYSWSAVELDIDGTVKIVDPDLRAQINKLTAGESKDLIIAFEEIGEFTFKVQGFDDEVSGDVSDDKFDGSEFFNETIEITLSGGDDPDAQSINSVKFAGEELEQGTHYTLQNGKVSLNLEAIGNTYSQLKSEIEALAQGASKDINIEIEVQDGANDTDTITKEITINGDFVEEGKPVVTYTGFFEDQNSTEAIDSDTEILIDVFDEKATGSSVLKFKLDNVPDNAEKAVAKIIVGDGNPQALTTPQNISETFLVPAFAVKALIAGNYQENITIILEFLDSDGNVIDDYTNETNFTFTETEEENFAPVIEGLDEGLNIDDIENGVVDEEFTVTDANSEDVVTTLLNVELSGQISLNDLGISQQDLQDTFKLIDEGNGKYRIEIADEGKFETIKTKLAEEITSDKIGQIVLTIEADDGKVEEPVTDALNIVIQGKAVEQPQPPKVEYIGIAELDQFGIPKIIEGSTDLDVNFDSLNDEGNFFAFKVANIPDDISKIKIAFTVGSSVITRNFNPGENLYVDTKSLAEKLGEDINEFSVSVSFVDSSGLVVNDYTQNFNFEVSREAEEENEAPVIEGLDNEVSFADVTSDKIVDEFSVADEDLDTVKVFGVDITGGIEQEFSIELLDDIIRLFNVVKVADGWQVVVDGDISPLEDALKEISSNVSGKISITVKATDKAGNSTEATVNIPLVGEKAGGEENVAPTLQFFQVDGQDDIRENIDVETIENQISNNSDLGLLGFVPMDDKSIEDLSFDAEFTIGGTVFSISNGKLEVQEIFGVEPDSFYLVVKNEALGELKDAIEAAGNTSISVSITATDQEGLSSNQLNANIDILFDGGGEETPEIIRLDTSTQSEDVLQSAEGALEVLQFKNFTAEEINALNVEVFLDGESYGSQVSIGVDLENDFKASVRATSGSDLHKALQKLTEGDTATITLDFGEYGSFDINVTGDDDDVELSLENSPNSEDDWISGASNLEISLSKGDDIQGINGVSVKVNGNTPISLAEGDYSYDETTQKITITISDENHPLYSVINGLSSSDAANIEVNVDVNDGGKSETHSIEFDLSGNSESVVISGPDSLTEDQLVDTEGGYEIVFTVEQGLESITSVNQVKVTFGNYSLPNVNPDTIELSDGIIKVKITDPQLISLIDEMQGGERIDMNFEFEVIVDGTRTNINSNAIEVVGQSDDASVTSNDTGDYEESALDDGTLIGEFVVTDVDGGFTIESTVTLVGPELPGSGVSLSEGQDYTVRQDGNKYYVELTSAGASRIQSNIINNKEYSLEVNFKADDAEATNNVEITGDILDSDGVGGENITLTEDDLSIGMKALTFKLNETLDPEDYDVSFANTITVNGEERGHASGDFRSLTEGIHFELREEGSNYSIILTRTGVTAIREFIPEGEEGSYNFKMKFDHKTDDNLDFTKTLTLTVQDVTDDNVEDKNPNEMFTLSGPEAVTLTESSLAKDMDFLGKALVATFNLKVHHPDAVPQFYIKSIADGSERILNLHKSGGHFGISESNGTYELYLGQRGIQKIIETLNDGDNETFEFYMSVKQAGSVSPARVPHYFNLTVKGEDFNTVEEAKNSSSSSSGRGSRDNTQDDSSSSQDKPSVEKHGELSEINESELEAGSVVAEFMVKGVSDKTDIRGYINVYDNNSGRIKLEEGDEYNLVVEGGIYKYVLTAKGAELLQQFVVEGEYDMFAKLELWQETTGGSKYKADSETSSLKIYPYTVDKQQQVDQNIASEETTGDEPRDETSKEEDKNQSDADDSGEEKSSEGDYDDTSEEASDEEEKAGRSSEDETPDYSNDESEGNSAENQNNSGGYWDDIPDTSGQEESGESGGRSGEEASYPEDISSPETQEDTSEQESSPEIIKLSDILRELMENTKPDDSVESNNGSAEVTNPADDSWGNYNDSFTFEMEEVDTVIEVEDHSVDVIPVYGGGSGYSLIVTPGSENTNHQEGHEGQLFSYSPINDSDNDII
jgi:hypothetical protein